MKILLPFAIFFAVVVLAFVLAPRFSHMAEVPAPEKPTPVPISPEELCIGAGNADAKSGYSLFSAKCFPNGTMCFKYGQTHPERYEYFVVFSNGRTLAGDPNENYSIDDSGKVKLVSVRELWRKKMDCYGGKELIGH